MLNFSTWKSYNLSRGKSRHTRGLKVILRYINRYINQSIYFRVKNTLHNLCWCNSSYYWTWLICNPPEKMQHSDYWRVHALRWTQHHIGQGALSVLVDWTWELRETITSFIGIPESWWVVIWTRHRQHPYMGMGTTPLECMQKSFFNMCYHQILIILCIGFVLCIIIFLYILFVDFVIF